MLLNRAKMTKYFIKYMTRHLECKTGEKCIGRLRAYRERNRKVS